MSFCDQGRYSPQRRLRVQSALRLLRIRNNSPAVEHLGLFAAVEIRTVAFGSDGDLTTVSTGLADFARMFRDSAEPDQRSRRDAPFWLTVADGVVMRIEEQNLP